MGRNRRVRCYNEPKTYQARRMALTKDQIMTAVLELDPGEREALAEEILLSIGTADRQAIDEAWLAEVRRRDAEFRAGKMGAKPVDEVLSQISRNARR
jgi:putative addiction module component (TIGR02574 family)